MSLVPFLCLNCFSLLLLSLHGAVSEDIIGCGGFIKSDVEIDFSLIEVALYSKQGSLKYRTDCSPTNAYYLLPVYSKGEYTIKVSAPQGWTFEPEEVSLWIDGKEDACSTSSDINFVFTGFGVVGKVLSRGQDTGPEGVKVVLKEEGGGGIMGEVLSGKGGEYVFDRVLPGTYIVEASHAVWKFARRTSRVVVDRQTGLVEDDITVSGYPLMGSVLSDKVPVAGVHFLLYRSNQGDGSNEGVVEGCADGALLGAVREVEGAEFVCHVTSGKDGVFMFASVMSGEYTLISLHQSGRIKYDLQPSSISVSILHHSFVIKKAFVVSGFMVTGHLRKSAHSTAGIPGAVVMVDGAVVSKTTEDGVFQLEGMKTGEYNLAFQKEGFVFKVAKVKISPNDPFIPDLFPHMFQVCGRIILDNPGELGKARKVVFSNGVGVQVSESESDKQGIFCTHLPPGSFSASVETSPEEARGGFKLMPEAHDIKVLDDLIADVTFSQFHATVAGVVQCLEACGKVRLILSNLQNNNNDQLIQEVASDMESVTFEFSRVMTGSYELKLDSEERCWQNSSSTFTIVDRHVTGLNFQQTGVVVQAAISVPATVHFKPLKSTTSENNKEKTEKNLGLARWQRFDLHSKVNRFCLDTPGDYEVVVESCHQFEQQQYFYHTSERGMLILTAVSYPVSLVTMAKKGHTVYALVSAEDGREERVGPLEMGKKGTEGLHEYMHQYWSKQRGEQLRVSFESEVLLFEPKSVSLQVDPESCPSGEARSRGREGVFVGGSITPPLQAVEVILKFDDGGVVQVKTNQNGTYRVGPVDEGVGHVVAVAKRGYNFVPSPDNPDDFVAFKLAEIVVKVKDSDTGENLPGVLISLSGSKGFRRNNVTGDGRKEEDDDGRKEEDGDDDDVRPSLVFSSLDPGEYFMKPMMKEYLFKPASQAVHLQEGTTVVIEVVAKRIAYSCFGMVSSLNGEAEAAVYIEAVAIDTDSDTYDCTEHQEESKSEVDGSFRIRGLKPGCSYELSMKTDNELNNTVDRTSPKKMTIKINKADVTDTRFVVFRGGSVADVTGRVDTRPEYLSSLKAHIYSDSDLDAPLHVQSLALSPFFYFSVPMHKAYTIRLVCTLKRTHFVYSTPELKVHANISFHHFVLPFHPKARRVEQELKHSSVLILPFTLLLIYLAYHHKMVLAWMTQQVGSLSAMKSSSSSSFSSPSSSSTNLPSLLEGALKDESQADGSKKRLRAKKI